MKTSDVVKIVLSLFGIAVGIEAARLHFQQEKQTEVQERLADQNTSRRFDGPGFSFGITEGWVSTVPDNPRTKAMLLWGGSTWREAKAIIKVDVGRPRDSSAGSMALGLAKNMGGAVDAKTVPFDGVEAIHVTSSSLSSDKPRDAYVIFDKGSAILVMGGGMDAEAIAVAMNVIRGSWKWSSDAGDTIGK